MKTLSNRIIASEVLSLMRKDQMPRVEVKPSQIGAESGNGVFTTQRIKKGQGLCLYPGQYTPPIPENVIMEFSMYGLEPLVFKDSPITLSRNAYILNLNSTGGYIDGSPEATAVVFPHESSSKHSVKSYAVGNMINHPSGSKSNVLVAPFLWRKIVQESSPLQEFQDLRTVIINESFEEYYNNLPNYIRQDGSPWYFCPRTEEIIYHPQRASTLQCLTLKEKDHSLYSNLAGALILSNVDIKEGEELFLDYDLNEPFPLWAEGWYEPASS